MGRNKNFIEEEILDKTIELFQQQGFRTTSPEELVKHLGISRSSMYATFGDKQGLLVSALHRYRQLVNDAFQKVIAETTDPIQGIEKILDISVAGCYHPDASSGCFLVNSIIEFGPQDGDALNIVKESYDDCRNTLLHFIKLAQKKAAFKKLDAELIADYLMNAISGMVVSAKAGMDEQACRKVVRQVLAVFRLD